MAEKKNEKGRKFWDIGQGSNPRPAGARENAKQKKKKSNSYSVFCAFLSLPLSPPMNLLLRTCVNTQKYRNCYEVNRWYPDVDCTMRWQQSDGKFDFMSANSALFAQLMDEGRTPGQLSTATQIKCHKTRAMPFAVDKHRRTQIWPLANLSST